MLTRINKMTQESKIKIKYKKKQNFFKEFKYCKCCKDKQILRSKSEPKRILKLD